MSNNSHFWTRVSVINVSIIIDNLISNSIKSNAHNILIEILNPSEDHLSIDFSDDGDGLSGKYLKSVDDIFKIGETNRSGGSGIGLYTVKDLLAKMKGRIEFIGNNLNLKGAKFQILLSKQKIRE